MTVTCNLTLYWKISFCVDKDYTASIS